MLGGSTLVVVVVVEMEGVWERMCASSTRSASCAAACLGWVGVVGGETGSSAGDSSAGSKAASTTAYNVVSVAVLSNARTSRAPVGRRTARRSPPPPPPPPPTPPLTPWGVGASGSEPTIARLVHLRQATLSSFLLSASTASASALFRASASTRAASAALWAA